MTDLGYRAAALAARGLPRRASLWLADRCGDLYAWLHPGRTERIRARLDTARGQPGSDPRAIHRAFARSLRDFLDVRPDGERGNRGARVVVGTDAAGRAILDAVRASGRPVLVVSGHFGPWEIALGWLAAQVGGLDALADGHRSARVERYFARLRERRGVRTLSGPGAARRALSRLRAGGWIAALIDRESARSERAARTAEWGQDSLVRLHPRPLLLASRSRAIVLPGVAFRSEEDGVQVRFMDPFSIAPCCGGLPFPRALDRLRRFFDGHARARPTEWFDWEARGTGARPTIRAA